MHIVGIESICKNLQSVRGCGEEDPRVRPGGDERGGVWSAPAFHMGVMPAQAGIPLRAREAGPRLVPGVTGGRGGATEEDARVTRGHDEVSSASPSARHPRT